MRVACGNNLEFLPRFGFHRLVENVYISEKMEMTLYTDRGWVVYYRGEKYGEGVEALELVQHLSAARANHAT